MMTGSEFSELATKITCFFIVALLIVGGFFGFIISSLMR